MNDDDYSSNNNNNNNDSNNNINKTKKSNGKYKNDIFFSPVTAAAHNSSCWLNSFLFLTFLIAVLIFS